MMTPEILHVARAEIEAGAAPVTVSQIAKKVAKAAKLSRKEALLKNLPRELAAALRLESGIHEWPAYRKSPQFSRRSLADVVEEAVLQALAARPLTESQAGDTVKAHRVSVARIRKELKLVLPRMAATGKVFRYAVNRQAILYFSRQWMASQAGAEGRGDELPALIARVIERLQSGPGNYVRVDRLRAAPEVRAVVDRAVIRLAEAGELILDPYEGPRPVPADEEWAYIEDQRGNLFLGVALPRRQEA